MVFVDQHSGSSQNPTPVIWDAHIERIAQIIVGSTAPFLRIPYSPPSESLARHIGVEFPLFLFLLFEQDGGVELAADIVGRVHEGLVEGGINLIIPVLGHMKRRLYRADKFLLLTKVAS